MKASWLAILVDCSFLTTPINGTRIVRTFGARSHQSSLAQLNANNDPPKVPVFSFISGHVIMKATGSPSTSAIRIRSLKTIGFSCFPVCATSASVIGTKPQLPLHASFKIDRMIAASASKFFLFTVRMIMRSFRSPDATMRCTKGGKGTSIGIW